MLLLPAPKKTGIKTRFGNTLHKKDEEALKKLSITEGTINKCDRPCSSPSREGCLKCNTPHRGQKKDRLLTPAEKELLARGAINLDYLKKH